MEFCTIIKEKNDKKSIFTNKEKNYQRVDVEAPVLRKEVLHQPSLNKIYKKCMKIYKSVAVFFKLVDVEAIYLHLKNTWLVM